MEIYVLICSNSFSSFYFLCIIIMPKLFKIKISIPFTILFHKTLHSYNNLFLSSENVFKGLKHSLIYQLKGN